MPSPLAFDVRWRPFQLNPSLPTGRGLDKMQYYYDRFGGPSRVDGMIGQMKAVGRDVGIDFSYGGRVANTLDSHRLIWYARERGGSELQDRMVEELFRAYFTQEKSLGEREVLVECAVAVGMDVSGVLADDGSASTGVGASEVQEEMEAYARRWNCRGVPLFVIDDKYPLSGAQPQEAFLDVFDDLAESN